MDVLRLLGPNSSIAKWFVFCLSEDPDDLTQWRAYCSRGGYALGFHFESLSRFPPSGDTRIAPCIYDKERQRERMQKHISLWNGSDAADLGYALVSESARFKHPAFHNEREWRLIHIAPRKDCSDRLSTTYGFRPYNGRIVPCAKLKLDDDKAWSEVKVVVGPCPEAEMKESVAAVRDLLGYVNPNDMEKVTPSAIPYRHW